MRKICLGIFMLICMPLYFLSAQEPDDLKLSNTILIENAMVVTKAGMPAKKSSILIKDGIITQIGTNINVPGDAIVLKADSLYAYPAFIDACSHTAVPKGDKEEKQKEVKDPDKPGNKRAGITPQNSISNNLKLSDGSVKEMRKAGFAISHSVPRGRMLPGKGSIILLNDNDSESYLMKDFSQFGSLRSAKGRVYPSTIIAVMSKYRDLANQSRNAYSHEQSYKTNPLGLKRPNYSPELQALYPVMNQSQTFFMQAEKTLDISRALTLNKDLKTKMVIVEARQAWPNLKLLKNNNTQILLSLDIPEDVKEEKKDSTAVPDKVYEAMMERKKQSIMEYQNQAKFMHDNNVPFSFSYFDVKPKDIHKNLNKIIENGLDKKVVLDALTMTPAKMLGIDKVAGSLEAGKIGNVILSNKELFTEDSEIQYMIVEGTKYEFEKKEKKKKKKKKDGDSDDEAADVAGLWTVTVEVPGEEQEFKLKISKDGDDYSGVLVDDEGEETELESISVDGSTISFSFTVDIDEGSNMAMDAEAEVDGDDLEGSLSVGAFGSFKMTGTRTGKPK